MLRRGYRAKLINNYMHLGSVTELDTAKVARFPPAQLPLKPMDRVELPIGFALRST
jgi:hypothetical protein